MHKIAIFGLGAIGSVLTKYLIPNKNNQLFYFNRSTKTELRISFKNQLVALPIELNNQEKGPYDWIIVCLKAYHSAAAKAAIHQLIGPKTKIVVFRNGLNLTADFQDIIPASKILETIIDCPVQLHPDGHYLQIKEPKITLPKGPLSSAFQQLFTHSEVQVDIIQSFKTAQWEKLIESSSLGALQVLAGEPCVIFKDPKILAEYKQLITEGIAVAKADGVEITSGFKEALLEKLKGYPDHKGSSMLADKLSGRPLELDAKIGAVVKIGVARGVPILNSERIYKRLLGEVG